MKFTVEKEGKDLWWLPIKHSSSTEELYECMVEYSKSSRAKCHTCGENIDNKVVRVGFPKKYRSSGMAKYGYINSWRHMACAKKQFTEEGVANLPKGVFGFEELETEGQEELLSILQADQEEEEEVDPDEAIVRGPLPRMQPPEEVTGALLPYQEEGLCWMAQQEHSIYKGGILADEMGMGKTLQTISMLVTNKAPEGNPTLIVTPTSAMIQWREEIAKFTLAGTLKVLVFHDKRKSFTIEELKKYDVVLTTYPIIEQEWRGVVNKQKVECEYCNRFFLPIKLDVHLKYFCGPDAKRSKGQSKTERKGKQSKQTMQRAMRTLKIDDHVSDEDSWSETNDATQRANALPTLTNVYKELMAKANRPAAMTFWGTAKGEGKEGSEGEEGAAESTTPEGDGAKALQTEEEFETEYINTCVEMGVLDQSDAGPAKKRKKAAPKASGKKGKKAKQQKEEVESEGEEEAAKGKGKKPKAKPKPKGKKGKGKKALKENTEEDEDSESSPEEAPAPKGKKGKPTKKKAAAKKGKKGKKAADPEDGTSEDEEEKPVPKAKGKKGATKQQSARAQKASAKKAKGKKAKGKKAAESPEESESEKSESESEATGKKKPKAKAKKGKGKAKAKAGRRGQKRKRGESSEEEGPVADNSDEEGSNDEWLGEDGVSLEGSTIHKIVWHRIILDEAHKIKGRTTSTAKGVFSIRADIKWCLTGTPLQNRVSDMYALVRFLKMDPYAYYQCSIKGCECKLLCRDLKKCKGCGHPPLRHYSKFNRDIVNPIKWYGYVGAGKKAMGLLKTEVLDKVLLRRTKKERAADLSLPPLDVDIVKIELSPEERDFYESIYKQSRSKFDTFVDKGTLLHNYAHIFDLLTRLRQAADHPYLVVHGNVKRGKLLEDKSTGEGGVSVTGLPTKSAAPTELEEICGLCQENIARRHRVLTHCRHAFHRGCLLEFVRTAPQEESQTAEGEQAKADQPNPLSCPTCFMPLSVDLRKLEEEDASPHAMPSAESAPEEGAASGGDVVMAEADSAEPLDPLALLGMDVDPEPELEPEPQAEDHPAAPALVESMGDTPPTDSLPGLEGEHTEGDTQMEDGSPKVPVDPLTRIPTEKLDQTESTDSMPPLESERSLTTEEGSPRAEATSLKRRRKSTQNESRATIIQKVNTERFQSSTKVETVVKSIEEMLKRCEEEQKAEEALVEELLAAGQPEIVNKRRPLKAIVFSQFTSMLDIMEWRLNKAGMRSAKLVGSMPVKMRQHVLHAFRSVDNLKVLLLSLKAGGEGLNLQAATHVYLLDPWWNPAVEMQAIQRAHRIGQERPVKAFRFATADTIEERMLQLQEKKQLIFDGTVDRQHQALAKLTVEDMRFLFS